MGCIVSYLDEQAIRSTIINSIGYGTTKKSAAESIVLKMGNEILIKTNSSLKIKLIAEKSRPLDYTGIYMGGKWGYRKLFFRKIDGGYMCYILTI